eukprot:16368-Heterococcus_DN1.PRE.5
MSASGKSRSLTSMQVACLNSARTVHRAHQGRCSCRHGVAMLHAALRIRSAQQGTLTQSSKMLEPLCSSQTCHWARTARHYVFAPAAAQLWSCVSAICETSGYALCCGVI